MYQALYRKYRPITFTNVVGQGHITTILQNQIVKERVAHAYIFTGTRGTGKTSCAKILARAVNCENPQNGDPCNECQSCLSILNESSMDVSEIDAASNNKVDDIREILDQTRYTPTNLKKRVFIIDEVHMLTQQAFNALLKTLEEPPSHVIFILATTEIHKVLPTILSRCQRFDFKRINIDDISDRLVQIAQIEGYDLEKLGADIIAKLAEGGLRDALSILDRCIISEEKTITAEMVCQRVGSIDYTTLIELMDSVISYDVMKAISQINEFYLDGIELVSVLHQLITLSRDMLLYKITKDNNCLIMYDFEKIQELCEKVSENRLTGFIDSISNSLANLQKSQNIKVDIELCIIKITKNVKKTNENFENRLDILEEKFDNFKPTVVVSKPNEIVEEKPAPRPNIERKPLNPEEKGEENVEKYRHLLRNLKSVYKNRELIFLNENSKATFYNDRIHIFVKDEITYNLLGGIEKLMRISDKATELFEKDLFIEVKLENEEKSKTSKTIEDILDYAQKNNITVNNLEE